MFFLDTFYRFELSDYHDMKRTRQSNHWNFYGKFMKKKLLKEMFGFFKKVLILFEAQKLLLRRSSVYRVGVLHHYIFIISQLRLTFHPRSTVVLLDRVTPGTSREIYSEDTDGDI